MEIVANDSDFTTNIRRALSDIDGNYQSYCGIIVAGSHTPGDIERKIAKIKEAREKGIPFLGICLGHQLACIEWARNVMGIEDATSDEFGTMGTSVVHKLPKLNVGIKEVDGRMESFWNNYTVDPEIEEDFMRNKPVTMFTAQFHPEYADQHPLLVAYIELCKSKSQKV